MSPLRMFLLASLAGIMTLAAPAAPALADDPLPAPRSMSLADAIAHARAHQPRALAALERVRAAQLSAAVPSGAWLPRLGATAQLFAATANNTTTSTLGVPFVDLPRIGGERASGSGTLQPYASTLAAVGVRQELFDVGRIAAQTAVQDALVDVERQRERRVTLDLTFSVSESYYAVLAARAILAAAEGAYDRALIHRDLAAAGVQSGMRSPIEQTRAEADLARFELGRTQARGNLAIAQAAYAAAVGVDDPALDAPSNAQPTAADLPALSAALTRAAAADPTIQALIAELRASEARTRAIAAEGRPDLSLTAALSLRAGGAKPSGDGETPDGLGFLPRVPNWDVGVVFTWPLFDGVLNARVAAARGGEHVQQRELDAARFELVAAIRQAYTRVSVARAALPALVRATETAGDNYVQAETRFKEGLGTSVELADAQNLRADAEVQQALGEFSLARARAAFGRLFAEGL